MLNLYLIRHAESELNNTTHIICWRSNHVLLSEKWKLQAKLLWQRLQKEKVNFDEVYSSTAIRAIKTAEIVWEQIKNFPKNIITLDNFLELDQWEYEGRIRADIYTEELFKKINEDNWNFTPPGWESQKMAEERMLNWININLIPRYEENITVAIFGHWYAIKCLMRWIMDFAPRMSYHSFIDNTSITKLRYDKRGWFLASFGDAGHLLEK